MVVLTERLKEEVERQEVIQEGQVGSEGQMGTIDYLCHELSDGKQLGEKREVSVLFMNLKAAFDSMDRGVLIEAMRERKIRERLIGRVEEMVKETKSTVRIEGEIGESFWTARGIR